MDPNHAPLITLKEPCRASQSPPANEPSRHRSRGRVKNVDLRHRLECYAADLMVEVD